MFLFLARNVDGLRITATRDESGFCPSCNEQLAAKLGDIYVWHWSHRPGQACSYRKASTFWQYGWMSHYHVMGAGWEIETQVGSFEFDGVNREKKLSLMLAVKLDQTAIQAFITASNKQGLKPMIIFHPKAFKGFQLKDFRVTPPRRANNYQGIAAQQVQHAFEIVGEHMQAYLGAHPVERSGEKVGGAHPRLQRAERELDRLTADSHHFRRLIQTTLHRLEYGLMLPASHPALRAWCALLFQRTTLAVRAPVAVQFQSFLDA